ncbi:MAG: hypothetical protein F9K40_00785 [Kofleriaceae bacterium]|nr:MAG: hypothetical protein F9K40_00785 [Kofleriaceae bacterium]
MSTELDDDSLLRPPRSPTRYAQSRLVSRFFEPAQPHHECLDELAVRPHELQRIWHHTAGRQHDKMGEQPTRLTCVECGVLSVALLLHVERSRLA